MMADKVDDFAFLAQLQVAFQLGIESLWSASPMSSKSCCSLRSGCLSWLLLLLGLILLVCYPLKLTFPSSVL